MFCTQYIHTLFSLDLYEHYKNGNTVIFRSVFQFLIPYFTTLVTTPKPTSDIFCNLFTNQKILQMNQFNWKVPNYSLFTSTKLKMLFGIIWYKINFFYLPTAKRSCHSKYPQIFTPVRLTLIINPDHGIRCGCCIHHNTTWV